MSKKTPQQSGQANTPKQTKKTDLKLTKLTIDTSILLAVIIAGAAIIAAIDSYFNFFEQLNITLPLPYHHPINYHLCKYSEQIQLKLHWYLICQISAVVITTLRFFHGNTVWYSWDHTTGIERHELTAFQKVVIKLAHYFIHILQYIFLFVAAKIVGNLHLLIILFLIISGLDVIWTFANWLSSKKDEIYLRQALASWVVLNVICVLFLIGFLNNDVNRHYQKFSLYLAILYGVCAIADYFYNSMIFFGVDWREKLRRKGNGEQN